MAQDPLSLLCIEPRFPGRLGAVADWLVRKRGYRCQFYCANAHPDRECWPPSTGRGMTVIQYNAGGVARESAVNWTRDLERGLCYAYGCWEVLNARRPQGIDIVLGRSATLGSTLFVPAFQPGLPIVNYFDYYHHPYAHDVAADLGPFMPPQYFHWRRTTDAMNLLDLENSAHAWTATEWQRNLFPREYHKDFLVLHPGIDTARFTESVIPNPSLTRRVTSPTRQRGIRNAKDRRIDGRTIPPETRVVSFVSRSLDRLRGFDRFVRLANRLLADDPNVLCIAAGGTSVERGLDVEFFGKDYAAHVLAQTPPHDPDRFRMLGSVRPAAIAELLAISDLHVYPSRPYPLAQSLLEAMAAGCVVLAWDSEPIREILTPHETGLIVSPDDEEAAFRQARTVLSDPAEHIPLGRAAAPARFADKIEVHFDGIDTELYQPRPAPGIVAGLVLPTDKQIVTFVARGLESLRGFDLFLRLAARIARERPDVLFVIAGEEQTHYGWDAMLCGGESFKQWAMKQGDYDPSRFLFVGQVDATELAAFRPLGVAARRAIEEKYSLEVALPALKAYFEALREQGRTEPKVS